MGGRAWIRLIGEKGAMQGVGRNAKREMDNVKRVAIPKRSCHYALGLEAISVLLQDEDLQTA
jgi:hypothetical protein